MRAILWAGIVLGTAGVTFQLALGAQSTQVVKYAPFGSSGLQPGYTVTSTLHGRCSTGSVKSLRPDAWRCMVANTMYEPCFSNAALSSVACPSDAFSKKVVLLILDKPLPVKKRKVELSDVNLKDGPPPWALLLDNGARCYVTGGAYLAAEASNERTNFLCGSTGSVYGYTDESKQPWRVFYQVPGSDAPRQRVSVRQAII
jgi:hypothetical protein